MLVLPFMLSRIPLNKYILRFVLFYFWIPHHEIYKIFGTQYESRTHTLEGLSLLPLPIGLIVHGVLRKSRTYNIWNLNPASLPIGLVALYKFLIRVHGRGLHDILLP